MFEICSDLSKSGFKIFIFLSTFKKAKKWPNGQTILFLANSFKECLNWQIWPLKRPNGNPASACLLLHKRFVLLFQLQLVVLRSPHTSRRV